LKTRRKSSPAVSTVTVNHIDIKGQSLKVFAAAAMFTRPRIINQQMVYLKLSLHIKLREESVWTLKKIHITFNVNKKSLYKHLNSIFVQLIYLKFIIGERLEGGQREREHYLLTNKRRL